MTYRGVCQPKLFGEVGLPLSSSVAASDGADLGFSQFGRVVSLAMMAGFGAALPTDTPLCRAVEHVGLLIAQEEVRWPNAGRIVTGMAEVQSVRDASIGNRPGEAVGTIDPLVRRAEDAVAAADRLRPRPDPARAKIRTVVRNGAVLIDSRSERLNVGGAILDLHQAYSWCQTPGASNTPGSLAVEILP